MTGADLYRRYVALFARCRCTCDKWNELDAKEQAVWTELAAGLQPIESP